MAGHSKWSQIKRQKEANDKARGNTFAKLSQGIILAVKEGGGVVDPALNLKLRIAIDRAKSANMPKSTIAGAIEKAQGSDGADVKRLIYEAFGPGGSALMITATSDNPNRTHAAIRSVIDRNGGAMGSKGSVAHLFTHCVVVRFSLNAYSEEDILSFAERIGALDLEKEGDVMYVFAPFHVMGMIDEYLNGIAHQSAPEEVYRPLVVIEVSVDDSQQVDKLVASIEMLDDVDIVFTNI